MCLITTWGMWLKQVGDRIRNQVDDIIFDKKYNGHKFSFIIQAEDGCASEER